MRQTFVLAFGLLVIVSSPAVSQVNDSADVKSPGAALTRSLGWTLGPLAAGGTLIGLSVGKGDDRERNGVVAGLFVAGTGLLIGPITGHAYAGNAGHSPGMPFRLAGIGFGVLGLGFAVSADSFFSSEAEMAAIMIGTGSALVIIAAIVDISTVAGSVDKYNRKALKLTPAYSIDDGTTGLHLCLTF